MLCSAILRNYAAYAIVCSYTFANTRRDDTARFLTTASAELADRTMRAQRLLPRARRQQHRESNEGAPASNPYRVGSAGLVHGRRTLANRSGETRDALCAICNSSILENMHFAIEGVLAEILKHPSSKCLRRTKTTSPDGRNPAHAVSAERGRSGRVTHGPCVV